MMKNVLCYGDSNTWGAAPVAFWGDARRFGFTDRWPGVLRQELGGDYWVIEEGHGGRTTVWDDPVEGEHKNGKKYLLACLESHRPLDLVILLLGTNDLKKRFGVGAFDIAAGAETLVKLIQASATGPDLQAPKILLMCPPPLGALTLFADMFEGATEKAQRLAPHYRRVADMVGCAFLNTGDVIVSSDGDGIHWDVEAHHTLGRAVAVKVREILGTADPT